MTRMICLMVVALSWACKGSNSNYTAPENALDCGREFIQQSLQGHFNSARNYLLPTEENLFWFERVSKEYNKYPEQDKNGYSNASINILEIKDEVKDSVTIIHYSNSYIKRPQELKVVKFNGEWKVDLQYTFAGEN